jgi:transposase
MKILISNHSIKVEGPMKNIKTLGIDLAKNVFQVHGIDAKGKKVMTKRLSRKELKEFISKQKPCTIAIEACGSAHYWGREFQSMGHEVKMMAPQFVKPYIQANKNDANDAAGIAEAATRPRMKFVALKTVAQQDMLLIHRSRSLFVKQRTALSNHIRGLLAEYGIILPKSANKLNELPVILDKTDKLTALAKEKFTKLYEQWEKHDKEVVAYDKEIKKLAEQDPQAKALMEIEGIGPITATAAVASIGDAKVYKNGREMSAWLGLVPRQHSSGNKLRLGGISKRGDRYIRTLLVHGARAVVRTCGKKTDKRSLWIASKKAQKGHNVAAVAVANKNARIIWAILAKGASYQRDLAA